MRLEKGEDFDICFYKMFESGFEIPILQDLSFFLHTEQYIQITNRMTCLLEFFQQSFQWFFSVLANEPEV